MHNTIVDLKPIPNSKSSEEDKNQLQLQDANTTLSGEVKGLIKLETVPELSREGNDDNMVQQQGMLSEHDPTICYRVQIQH